MQEKAGRVGFVTLDSPSKYAMSPAQDRTAFVIQWIFRRAARLFFRQLNVVQSQIQSEPSSAEHVRRIKLTDDAPTLIIANHPNALVDCLLVYVTVRKPIRFVAKSTLWNVAILRPLLWMGACIPVFRKEDAEENAKKAPEDPNKVLSNSEAINLVARAFWDRDFAIFPEGRSHESPVLDRFKTGPARILLQSAHLFLQTLNEKGFTKGLVEARAGKPIAFSDFGFQPVGLYFDKRQNFRSRALAHYGPRVSLADVLTPEELNDFAHHYDKGVTIRRVTKAMEASVGNLVQFAASTETLNAIRNIAKLMLTPLRRNHIAEQYRWETIVREIFETGHEESIADHEKRALLKDVEAYFTSLDEHQITDQIVRDFSNSAVKFQIRALRRAFRLCLWGIASLPFLLTAWILYALPMSLVNVLSKRLAVDSTEHSTYKFIGGYLILGSLSAVYGVVSYHFLAPFLPRAFGLLMFFLPAACFWLMVNLSEFWVEYLRDIKVLLNPLARRDIGALAEQRRSLVSRLWELF